MFIRLLNFSFLLLALARTGTVAPADPEQTVVTPVTPVKIKKITPVKFEDSKLAHLVAEQKSHETQEHIEPEKKSGHDNTPGEPKKDIPHAPDPEFIPIKTIGDQTEVEVCSSLSLTGEEGQLGKQINDGMNLFFNKLKKDKKAQRLVKLYVLDDHSDFIKSKANLIELMHQSPALLNLYGSDVLLSKVKNLVEAKKIAAIFPIEGREVLRKPTYTQMIYLRASYEDELKAIVQFSITELNHKKFAAFYEASDWGESVLQSLKKILATHNLTLLAEGAYPQGTVNVSDAVSKISKTSPNTVLCIAQSRPAYSFILKAIDAGMYKSVFLGLSNLLSIQKNIQKSLGVKLIVSSVVPDPEKSTIPLAKQYRDDMKKYLPNRPISPYSFEAYINAMLFYEGIKEMQAPLATAQLISRLEGITDVHGFKLSFDQTTRTLCHQVWISDGSDKEWVLSHPKDTETPSTVYNEGENTETERK